MGFFSWKTSDTHESISNSASNRGALPVYLLCPHNNEVIYEACYDGYGVFGGHDAYALLARWNSPELCCGDDDVDREIGISLECSDEYPSNVKYPLKFVEDDSLSYDDVDASEQCPYQGFFYYEDEEDEEDYDDDYEENEEYEDEEDEE